MDFGVQVSVYQTEWEAVRASVEAMEAGPWNSVWFADHFVPPRASLENESLTAFEGISAIAFAGGMTKKLRLGNLVIGNTYRNPALVAKMAGTIDTMSKGRFTLAIGAGWCEREHDAYGWTFPTMKERQDRFEEAVELIRLLIHSDGPVDYNGKYYQLDKAPLSPGSYERPIPIMVGGSGPKRTLRTLARYGDVMNLDGWAGKGLALDYYKYKAGILDQHCEDCGRDPAEIPPDGYDALLPDRGQRDDRARRGVTRPWHRRRLTAVRRRPDRRVRGGRRRRGHLRGYPVRRRGAPEAVRGRGGLGLPVGRNRLQPASLPLLERQAGAIAHDRLQIGIRHDRLPVGGPISEKRRSGSVPLEASPTLLASRSTSCECRVGMR